MTKVVRLSSRMVNAARGMIARRRRARKKAAMVEATAVAGEEEEEEESAAAMGTTTLVQEEARVENGEHRISDAVEGINNLSGATFVEVRMNGALNDHLEEVIVGNDGEDIHSSKKYSKLRCLIDGDGDVGGREMLLVAEDVGDGIGECLVMVEDDGCIGGEVWEEGFVEEEVVSEETVVYEEEVGVTSEEAMVEEICEEGQSQEGVVYTDQNEVLDNRGDEVAVENCNNFSANGHVEEAWHEVDHSANEVVEELVEEVAELEVDPAKDEAGMMVAAEEEVVEEESRGPSEEETDSGHSGPEDDVMFKCSKVHEEEKELVVSDSAKSGSLKETGLPEVSVKAEEASVLVRDSMGEEDAGELEECNIKSTCRGRAGSTDTSCSSDGPQSASFPADEPLGLSNLDGDESGGVRRRRSSRIRSLLVSGKKNMTALSSATKPETVSIETKDGTVKSSDKSFSVTTPDPPFSSARSSSPMGMPGAVMPQPRPPQPSTQVPFQDCNKPVKVKSRWRRSSELEMGGCKSSECETGTTTSPSISPRLAIPPPPPLLPAPSSVSSCNSHVNSASSVSDNCSPSVDQLSSSSSAAPPSKADAEAKKGSEGKNEKREREMEERLRNFEIVEENIYLTERTRSKEAKRMVCDCTLSKEEQVRGEPGCGEDCLNSGSRCPVGDCCTNKRFQKKEYAKTEVFRTEKKGFGLRALQDMPAGTFVMEYVGEVLDPKEFRRRAKDYARERNRHYYFMALKSDTIIDATTKGNSSRFINHSCEPNAETQKSFIPCGDEITFDYQLQRYGKEAQRCYCEKPLCRGWIGQDPEKEKGCVSKSSSGFSKEKREKEAAAAAAAQEIEKLCASGLKNRAHTLTLCRLMVRAEERGARSRLLALLRDGEQACRRLFLDYHGLRLVWSWMIDMGGGVSSSAMDLDDTLSLRMEILETLAQLPIPNKTMLQDSKVLGVVQRWLNQPILSLPTSNSSTSTPSPSPGTSPPSRSSSNLKEIPRNKERLQIVEEESPSDLEAPKPKGDVDEKTSEGPMTLMAESEKQVVDAEGNKENEDKGGKPGGKEGGWQSLRARRKDQGAEDGEDGEDDDGEDEGDDDDEEEENEEEEGVRERKAILEDEATAKVEDREERQRLLTDLASSLIENWSFLKEVFRIPKKERLEQMKEHEREADRGYKEYLDKEGHHNKQSYVRHWRHDRFHHDKRERKRGRGSTDMPGIERPTKKKPLLDD
ncbi:hypothetical protein J437_LFUL000349, partial [Ladona fulva]